MTDPKQKKLSFNQILLVIAGIFFSGLAWYFSNGLNGNFWWLLWLAPVPVLLISLNVSGRTSFIISFLAYLVGRLSWFSYLQTVAALAPAIIFTILLPLIFALIIAITRRTVIKTKSWYSVFAFPVFFTVFEFLLIRFSADGTAGSIAYSQSDFLPMIQIASITGLLGISFMVCLIPSVIALAWFFRNEKIKLQYILFTGGIIIISVLLFGIVRINNKIDANTITVGLAVLDENLHNMSGHPDFKKEDSITNLYAKEIKNLASTGAKLIVLPERAINIDKETSLNILNILGRAAKENKIFIVTGYTNFKNDAEKNSALVINPGGEVIADYNKAHLVKGLEDQFTPGNETGLFKLSGMQEGVAICKDLDFTSYIKKYGGSEVNFLAIPAWDFIVDDWLHSRMAILRGVENGFSEIRTARLGRLTISDYYGRVNYEANASNKKQTELTGMISTTRINTFYTRFGDWFGIINLIAALILVFTGSKKKTAP